MPFSKAFYQKVISKVNSAWFLIAPFILQKWSRITISATGDEVSSTTSTLFLMNHISNLDWLALISYGAHKGSPLPGSFKGISKSAIGKIPFIGWILHLSDFIFLKRSWKEDHLRLNAGLLNLARYSENVCPLWLLIFPEGTRQTEEKLKSSQKFSKENGKYVFKNLLYPRFKGFQGLIPIMRSSIETIVDCTIVFEKASSVDPSLFDLFSGRADSSVCFQFRTYRMDALKENPDALKEWLLERWIEKDAMIQSMKDQDDIMGIEPKSNVAQPSYLPLYLLFALNAVASFLILTSIHLKYGIFYFVGIGLVLSVVISIIARSSLTNSSAGLAAKP